MTNNQSEKIEVFISYSKQDKEFRDGLLSHLRPLENEGIISWYDRQILPGTQWDDEIKARLNSADIILLLLSADFLATDYCTKVEIPEALRRHQSGEATVMPVILRHCGWEYTRLAQIQAYPEKAQPIKSWTDIDAAYLDVVRGVHRAAKEIKKRRQAAQEQIQQEQQRQAEEQERQLQVARLQQQAEATERQRQRELEQQRQAAEAQRKQAAQTVSANELASERGVDYTQLERLLKAGQWQAADQETAKRMCEVMGRQQQRWLRGEDLQNFPCTDLRTIDRLWVKQSNGHFGFSVQKKIWQKCGSPTLSGKDWDRFCVEVGWQNSTATAYMSYSDLKFDSNNSSFGELPFGGRLFEFGSGPAAGFGGGGLVGGWWSSLLSRRDL